MPIGEHPTASRARGVASFAHSQCKGRKDVNCCTLTLKLSAICKRTGNVAIHGRLTTSQAAVAIQAAIRTARRLLSDAELLRANGRWARATVLAILAIEEVGKLGRWKYSEQSSQQEMSLNCRPNGGPMEVIQRKTSGFFSDS